MSFVLACARFAACALLFVLHPLLCGLLALSLTAGPGPFEICCLIISMCTFLLLLTQIFHALHCSGHGSELSRRSNMLYAGVMFLMSFVESLVITARASRTPSLWADFSKLPYPYAVASAVLALSWCSTVVAIFNGIVSFLDKDPETTDEDSYTSVPKRHRVVFHQDNVPIRVITIDYSATLALERPPESTGPTIPRPTVTPPNPAHVHWMERRPRPMRAFDNRWYNDEKPTQQ